MIFFSQPLSPCKSGVDALMLLWLAILLLLAIDLVDDDPTLFAACIFEKAPIGIAGRAVVTAVTVPISEEGVFSPNSQYVVTLPLPCEKWIFIIIEMRRIRIVCIRSKITRGLTFSFLKIRRRNTKQLFKQLEITSILFVPPSSSLFLKIYFWKTTISSLNFLKIGYICV